VRFYGAFRNEKLTANFLVAFPRGHGGEHVQLPLSQLRVLDPLDELLCDRGWKVDFSPVNPAYGLDQSLPETILEQIPPCARLHRALNVLGTFEGGKHDRLRRNVQRGELRQDLDAIMCRHPKIEQHDVGLELANDRQRFAAIGRLGYHLHFALLSQVCHDPFPDDGMIVGNHDANLPTEGCSILHEGMVILSGNPCNISLERGRHDRGEDSDRVNSDERGISNSVFGGNKSSLQRRLPDAWRNRYRRPVMKPRSETRVVIVGGGFGGLAAAKALRRAPVQVTLIDRNNHHLFQPLLYQVATSVLAPGNIAFPIRGILGNQRNTRVLMGEVTGVDKDRRCITLNVAGRQGVELPYDTLILALGARTNYFGRADFEKFTIGLKTVADAVSLRNRILRSFEQAEAEEVPARQRELLTFVVVGGGPTGVEMAAAIAVLVRATLHSEFRRVDPASTRIVLVDGGRRVLGAFAETLSEAAARRLEALGVEVRLGKGVDEIDENGVIVGGERIGSRTVVWAAGVAASSAGKWLNAETDRAGAVRIQGDLTVPGCGEIFVIGDTASLDQDGRPLPGVAQVAIQQGHYAGRVIAARVAGRPSLPPFRYFDKGNMAVVGKGFAVLQAGRFRRSGFAAWLVWGAIHLQFLATNGLRLSVLVQWLWTIATGQRGSRIIVKHLADTRQS